MKSISRLLSQPPRPLASRTPIPVAMVITDLDVGGAERAFTALATGLDRSTWDVSVVCLDKEGELVSTLRSAGIPTVCLNADRRRPLATVLRLAAELRRRRPALVQSFLFHANIAARLAAPLAGRPIVLGGLRVAERRSNGHLKIDRLTQTLAAGSVCVSEGVRRFSVEAGGIDPGRLVVIPNGVDPRRFDEATPASRDSLGLDEGRPLGVYVGRLDPQKGVSFLLQAAATVPGFDLLMVGDGPERDRLRAEADRLPGLAGRLHWLGKRADVPALLRTADFLVLPSLWEGMPNVVLEAMAAGIAVIGTAVEGTEDLVVPGSTGLLVPPSDADKLAEALRAAVADPSRLRAWGAAGRARVAERHAPEAIVRAYERLWLGVLGLERISLAATD